MYSNTLPTIASMVFLFFVISFSMPNEINAQSSIDPVQVDGIIHTTDGGIKFPDNTIQTTAALPGGPSSYAAPSNAQPQLWVDDNNSSLISIDDTLSVLAFENLGITIAAILPGGGGGGAPPAEIQSFSFTKNIDQFSPYFLERLASSYVIPEIFVRLSYTDGETYQLYTYRDVYIESSIGKSVFDGSGYKNIEEITFLPSVIQVDTWFNNEGMMIQGPTICWNQITNSSACGSPGAP